MLAISRTVNHLLIPTVLQLMESVHEGGKHKLDLL